jgi:hypothetical protein
MKNYLKAFINLDRSPLQHYFTQYDTAEVRRTVVCEVIVKRNDFVVDRSESQIVHQKKGSLKSTIQLMPHQRFPLSPSPPSCSCHLLVETAAYLVR